MGFQRGRRKHVLRKKLGSDVGEEQDRRKGTKLRKMSRKVVGRQTASKQVNYPHRAKHKKESEPRGSRGEAGF